MNHYNFDEVIERKNTPASKWNPNYLNSLFGSTDILPFWIADMDFKSPPALLEAIINKARHGILAYEYSTDSFYAHLIDWISNHHHYLLKREHIIPAPSIGASVGVIIEALSKPGDGVITQPPVFMEYKNWIKNNKRKIIKNRLIETDGIYSIDFEDLENLCKVPTNRLLILCNPHNPIGQIWNTSDLTQILKICQANDVTVIADEVHGDIVYEGHHFHGALSLPDHLTTCVVSAYSPVKTFNLGGFTDSFLFTKNPDYKDQISAQMKKYSLGKTNGIVRAGLEAGFSEGQPWLEELISYLHTNIKLIDEMIRKNKLPIQWNKPQASYQIWLDFRPTGWPPNEVHKFLCEKAKLGLNAGYWFGREGAGFSRMNIASTHDTVKEGMDRLAKAFL